MKYERRCTLPEDVLVSWKPETSPYGASFEPSLVYQDIQSVLAGHHDLRSLQNTSSHHHSPSEQRRATLDASLVSQLLRCHSDLISHWMRGRKSVDAIFAEEGSDEEIDLIAQEVASLTLAGRCPVVVCEPIMAAEYDVYAGVQTDIALGRRFLKLTVALKPFLQRSRCIVVPSHEYIDSVLLQEEGVGDFWKSMSPSVTDLFASSKPLLQRGMPLGSAPLVSMVSHRPVATLVTDESSFVDVIDEHAASYALYRDLVADMIKDVDSARDDSGFRDSLRKFDAGLAELQVRYEKHSRALNWEGAGCIVGLAATAMCMAAPDLGRTLPAIFGSATVWQGLSFLRHSLEREKSACDSKHWFPWYLKHRQRK